MILSLSRVVPRRLHTSRTTSACPMRPHARATRFHRRNDWSSDADARKIALKNLENKRWRKRFLWKSGWSLKPCVISSYFQTCLDGFNRPRCFRVEPSTRKVKIDFLPTCFWVGRYIYIYIYIYIHIYIYTYIYIYIYWTNNQHFKGLEHAAEVIVDFSRPIQIFETRGRSICHAVFAFAFGTLTFPCHLRAELDQGSWPQWQLQSWLVVSADKW